MTELIKNQKNIKLLNKLLKHFLLFSRQYHPLKLQKFPHTNSTH